MSPQRTIAVWCPDWPVVAACGEAEVPAEAPAAVVTGHQVVACSHAARQTGVRRGQRRREAQSRCPDLVVLPRNELAESRAFEPVVVALESIAPGVEIARPGLAAIGARGPTRYFGGETEVLRALSRALVQATSDDAGNAGGAGSTGSDRAAAGSVLDVLIGIADGFFAAEQAARRGVIVPVGQSAAFLADLPIGVLAESSAESSAGSGAESSADAAPDRPEFADLLRRLGVRTLGDFAALPPRDVFARFGAPGAWAQRQAAAQDSRPVAARRPPVEFAVTCEFEPAVDRVDVAAFSARAHAEEFIAGLAAYGVACTCLELEVTTENGEQAVRRWRHTGVLRGVDVIDRIRWQLAGWLGISGSGGAGDTRTTGGIVRLRLVPIETVPTGAHQQTLWGGSGDADERVDRAMARVQTMLGHGSVLRPVFDGGRDPTTRTRLVPWGDEPEPLHSPQQPWPGAMPAPAPSILFDPPRPAMVLDASGAPVTVTARGAVPRPPARFGFVGEEPVAVEAWAGPWPVDERWWTAERARCVVRCQLVDVRGRAYLVSGAVGGASDRRLNGLDVVAAVSDSKTVHSATTRWYVDAAYD